MNSVLRVAAFGVAVFGLLACGGSQPASQSVGDVSLHVTGGITGWDRTIVVAKDGTVTLVVAHGPSPVTQPARLDAVTLARLHQLVSDPAFAALADEYPGPTGGADLQHYAVSAEVAGNTVSSAASDGAAEPQILRDVISILSGIMARAGA